MTRTIAIAAAAIAITAVLTSTGMASPCYKNTYTNAYVAPTYNYTAPAYPAYYNPGY